MPTFYEGEPIETIEQTVAAGEWASAYEAARSAVSPMHRKEVKSAICLTAGVLLGSLLPLYRSRFLTVWVPVCGIFIFLCLAVWFFFFQPKEIRRWARELYGSNALLALPQKITVFRDSVVIENEREKILEYWTDFFRCIETEKAFILSGGMERNLLVISKNGLAPEQVDRLSAHFSHTFASRYLKSR